MLKVIEAADKCVMIMYPLEFIRDHSLITLGSRGGRGWKNFYILVLWEGGVQTHSYEIFSKSIFYIRNRAVKWFGRDHISFIL